jgi:hypothetical protein
VLRPTHEKNHKRVTIILLGIAATAGLILFSRLGGGMPMAILAAVAAAASLFLIATFFHRLELTRVRGPAGDARVLVRGGRPLWWRIPRELPVGQGAGVVRPVADRYRGAVVGWSWQYTLTADPRFAVSIGYSTREEDVSRVPYDVRDIAGRLSKLFGVPWEADRF